MAQVSAALGCRMFAIHAVIRAHVAFEGGRFEIRAMIQARAALGRGRFEVRPMIQAQKKFKRKRLLTVGASRCDAMGYIVMFEESVSRFCFSGSGILGVYVKVSAFMSMFDIWLTVN